jgi:hypothetical protein
VLVQNLFCFLFVSHWFITNFWINCCFTNDSYRNFACFLFRQNSKTMKKRAFVTSCFVFREINILMKNGNPSVLSLRRHIFYIVFTWISKFFHGLILKPKFYSLCSDTVIRSIFCLGCKVDGIFIYTYWAMNSWITVYVLSKYPRK